MFFSVVTFCSFTRCVGRLRERINYEGKVQKFLRVAKNRFNIEFDLEATDENGAKPLELVKK